MGSIRLKVRSLRLLHGWTCYKFLIFLAGNFTIMSYSVNLVKSGQIFCALYILRVFHSFLICNAQITQIPERLTGISMCTNSRLYRVLNRHFIAEILPSWQNQSYMQTHPTNYTDQCPKPGNQRAAEQRFVQVFVVSSLFHIISQTNHCLAINSAGL
jgi:hypothetical protein